MSSTIPPLLSNTPPPIDFENDDDFGGFDGNDSTFCHYDDETSLPATPEHDPSKAKTIMPTQSMKYLDDKPIEVNANIPTVDSTDERKEEKWEEEGEVKMEDALDVTLPEETVVIEADHLQAPEEPRLHPEGSSNEPSRCSSPPSLQLAADKYSDNECDTGNDDEIDEFQEPSNELSANAKSEDSHSLPSLNLDSIRNSPVKSEESEENVIENAAETPQDDICSEVLENVEESPKCSDSTESVAAVESTEDVSFVFDADFTQFSAFESEPAIEDAESQPEVLNTNQNEAVTLGAATEEGDDDFGDFEEANVAAEKPAEEVPSDDDDDFGDFNDFQQEPLPQAASIQSPTNLPPSDNLTISSIDLESIKEKSKSIILSVFSPDETVTPETDAERTAENINLSNDMTVNLKDFENSKALRHQWNHSAGKNCLIKSLGIDSRNILYGEKWKSPMPRFAANLGYNPLEPLKPTTVDPSQSAIYASNKSKGAMPRDEHLVAEVPAAQFDWNSAGLVNPLDGSKEVVHNADNTENKPARTNADQQKPLESSTESKDVPVAPELSHKPVEEDHIGPSHQDALEPVSLANFQPISSSYTAPGSSGTLKETHIFTPVKISASSAQWPTEQEKKPVECTDYDLEKAAAGVIIKENVVKKEYRDIEYDPNKLTRAASEADDFSDFQSVAHAPAADPFPSVAAGILQPVKAASNVTIDWPDPGNVASAGSLDELSNYVPKAQSNQAASNVLPDPLSCVSGEKAYPAFSKPSIGVSPSERMFENQEIASSITLPRDDDFSEFQSTKTVGIGYILHVSAIPDIISTCQRAPKPLSPEIQQPPPMCSQKNDVMQPSIVLNPTSILVPQLAPQPPQANLLAEKPQIDWPDPGISDDMLARIEAIFPQGQRVASIASEVKDSKPNAKPNANDDDEWSDFVSVAQPQLPITHILSQNLHKQQSNDEDDWTDFVSSNASPQKSNNFSSGPNFTAWNAPSPFNQWQSKAPVGSQAMGKPFELTSSPIRSNGHHHMHSLANGSAANHQQSQNYSLPSIISIPDLGFVAPKTLVNMPKVNPSKK